MIFEYENPHHLYGFVYINKNNELDKTTCGELKNALSSDKYNATALWPFYKQSEKYHKFDIHTWKKDVMDSDNFVKFLTDTFTKLLSSTTNIEGL